MPRVWLAAAAAVVLAAGGGTAWWLTSPREHAAAVAAVPVATAPVVRTTLTTTTQLSGTLGYAGSYKVTDQLAGTVTALARPGQVIRRGRRAFEVDGVPVFLFYGTRPAWRPFESGMTDGADVRELERNLVALGYGGGLAVDDTFTWYTEQAVRAWQDATGQVVTGTIPLGRVTFAPTALRVVNDAVPLGAVPPPGTPVLTASSRDPVVTAQVPATQTYLVHRGDRVRVTVPSGATTTGRVRTISSVAAAAGDSSDSGGRSNGSGGPPGASIPVTITLDHPAVAAGLDQAPVTVEVTDRQVRGVLAVPVTALVALAGGGYGVWVDAAGGRRLVAVTPGLFAQTLVQVTSAGLRAGDRVEVPSS